MLTYEYISVIKMAHTLLATALCNLIDMLFTAFWLKSTPILEICGHIPLDWEGFLSILSNIRRPSVLPLGLRRGIEHTVSGEGERNVFRNPYFGSQFLFHIWDGVVTFCLQMAATHAHPVIQPLPHEHHQTRLRTTKRTTKTFALSVGSTGASYSNKTSADLTWPLAAAQSSGVHSKWFLEEKYSAYPALPYIALHFNRFIKAD